MVRPVRGSAGHAAKMSLSSWSGENPEQVPSAGGILGWGGGLAEQAVVCLAGQGKEGSSAEETAQRGSLTKCLGRNSCGRPNRADRASRVHTLCTFEFCHSYRGQVLDYLAEDEVVWIAWRVLRCGALAQDFVALCLVPMVQRQPSAFYILPFMTVSFKRMPRALAKHTAK